MLHKIRQKIKARKEQYQKMLDENPTHFDNVVMQWTAPIRHRPKKGIIWVTFMVIIIAAMLFFGAETGNWIFVVAILIGVSVYAADHFEQGEDIQMKISDYGIKVGNHSIPYSNIKAFWIFYHPPFFSTLHIRTYEKLMPDIRIELMDQDPAKVREFLTRHIIEWEGKEESLMDIIARILKL